MFPQFIAEHHADLSATRFASSQGSNLRTHSLFVNDNWRVNNHFTFNLGLRLDKNQATDGGGETWATRPR